MKLDVLDIVLSLEKAIWQYVPSHKNINIHPIDLTIHLLKGYIKKQKKSKRKREKGSMYKDVHSHLETA